MRQEAVFLNASQDEPNLADLNDICEEMADRGLAIVSVTPCQGTGEDGLQRTVGLWLFFSDAVAQSRSPHVAEQELSFSMSQSSEVPRRWSVRP